MLDINKAYRVMITENGESRFYGIVVGARPADKFLPYPKTGKSEAVEWIPNSYTREQDYAFLKFLGKEGEDVKYKASETEEDIIYDFEYLTLERLKEVADSVNGDLSEFDSDSEVQEFFVENFLREDWVSPGTATEALRQWALLLQEEAKVAADKAREASIDLSEAKAAKEGEVRYWKSKDAFMKKVKGKWEMVPGTGKALGKEVRGTVMDVEGKYFQKQSDGSWKEVEPEGDLLPGEWKDRAEGLPASTHEEYWNSETNNYTLERRQLHEDIVGRILENVRPVDTEKHSKSIVITMGIPASGKSDAVQQTLNTANYAHVDPDGVREQLPEFKEAVRQRAKDGGSIVAKETNHIADQALFESISKGYNVVLEGVVASPEWYEKELIPHLKKNNYKISLLMVHAEDADAAVARAEYRGKRSGRFVPEDHIRKAHEAVPANFLKLAKQADSYAAYSSGRPPKKMYSKEEGKNEVVHDGDKYERFLSKARMEWWEVLVGSKLEEEGTKPTEVSWDEFLKVIEGVWQAEEEHLENTPEKFDKDQGVILPIVPMEKKK